jgi:5-(aminomethyl)-3-furanmethanol phosphate kinase
MGVIETVVKLGGAVLGSRIAVPRYGQTLIVPGGGPFADTVREIDARFAIGDDAAHWAAILAMDQYAHALASLVRPSRIVTGPDDLNPDDLAILAPYKWLRAADPLPHSWDVTSDSIAAWVAHAVGAKRLLLVKPIERAPDLVDRYFDCVKGDLDVRVIVVSALASPPAWHNLSCL